MNKIKFAFIVEIALHKFSSKPIKLNLFSKETIKGKVIA